MTELEIVSAASQSGYGIERGGGGGLYLTRSIGGVSRSIRVASDVDATGVTLEAAISYLEAEDTAIAVSSVASRQIYIPPSGGDDTAAFEAAALQVAFGGGHRIVLRDRAAYTVTQPLSFDATAGLAIEGNGATIDFRTGGSTATLFDLAGSEATIGTLTDDVAQGATSLPMTTTDGLVAGDMIMLVSGAANSWATGVAVGEMVRVLAIEDATHVTLQTPLAYAYASIEVITVTRLRGERLAIRDLRAIGRGSASASQVAIMCRHVPVQIDGLELEGFDNAGLRLRRVPGATVRSVRARNARAPGLAYGIAIDRGSRDVAITASHGEELRHFVTAGGSAGVNRHIIVSGCHATGMREAGLDAHPGCDEVEFTGNHIELSTDAESDGDGIMGQCPRFRATGNTVQGVRRHGIVHQVAGGQSHIVPVGVIESNQLTAAPGSGTRAAVIVQPSGTWCAPGRYYIERNRGAGTNFTHAALIDTQGGDIAWLDVNRTDIPGTATRGIHVIAKAGTAVRGGSVTHNHVGGGTNEAIYLQGVGADGVRDMLCGWNRSAGGSMAIRIVNGLRIDQY